jgi:hypothetical protein
MKPTILPIVLVTPLLLFGCGSPTSSTSDQSTPASEESSKTPAKPWPCADEAKKFCAEVKPGEGRIAECLKSKPVSDLSDDCRKLLKL